MIQRWLRLDINPEPWAIGTVAGRGIAPNPGLVAFKSAVRELIEDEEMMPDGRYKIRIWLWREQARYLDMKDKVRTRNEADATNMQKAFEDACQGILFKNDKYVSDIHTRIVRQGFDVVPKIIVCLEMAGPPEEMTDDIPLSLLLDNREVKTSDDRYEQADELF